MPGDWLGSPTSLATDSLTDSSRAFTREVVYLSKDMIDDSMGGTCKRKAMTSKRHGTAHWFGGFSVLYAVYIYTVSTPCLQPYY